MEELELEEEEEEEVEGEGYDAIDWQQPQATQSDAVLTKEEMEKRGFFDEGAGPPQVSPEELQVLDQQAMLTASCSGAHWSCALYLSQERIGVQHSVRLLSSYIATPTKTAMAAIKKLTT